MATVYTQNPDGSTTASLAPIPVQPPPGPTAPPPPTPAPRPTGPVTTNIPPPAPPPPPPTPPPAPPPPPTTNPPGFDGTPLPPGWWSQTMPYAPPPGKLPNSGVWKYNPSHGGYEWIDWGLDPGTRRPAGGSGFPNETNGNGTTTPGGYPVGPGTSPWDTVFRGGTSSLPPWYDPGGGFSLSNTVGGFTPPSTDFGKNISGIDMTIPGAAEAYWAATQGLYGQAGAGMNSLFQQFQTRYGNGAAIPTVGGAPTSSFGALPNMGPTAGYGMFRPPPEVGSRPPGDFGALPTARYGELGPRFGNITMPGAFGQGFGAAPNLSAVDWGDYFGAPTTPGAFGGDYGPLNTFDPYRFGDFFSDRPDMPDAFTGRFGPFQGPTGAPSGSFSAMGPLGQRPGEFGDLPDVGYVPTTEAFTREYIPGQTPGDFDKQDLSPANMDPYYQNEFRKAEERIRSTMAAKGMLGSSATDDQISELALNLAAEQAKEEADYGLRRSAESRAWETERTGYGLERSRDELSRSANALAWEEAKSGYGLNLGQNALERARLGLEGRRAIADYGLDLSQDEMARRSLELEWQDSAKRYEMDVAQYGLEAADQRLRAEAESKGFDLDAYKANLQRSTQALDWEQAASQFDTSKAQYSLQAYEAENAYQDAVANFGLNSYEANVARSQADLAWESAGAGYRETQANYGLQRFAAERNYQDAVAQFGLDSFQANMARAELQKSIESEAASYDLGRANYGVDLMAQQLAGLTQRGEYNLNLSQDEIARGNLDLAYTQAKGQFDLGVGSQNIDRYQALLTAQNLERQYGLQVSQDYLARAGIIQTGQAMNLGYANMLASLANNTANMNLQGLNAGMTAAQAAQLAQRTRAQDAFSNAMTYGGALSNTMGQNYQNMFQMDAQLFSQMQQLGLGIGAENLNQALMNYGLDQEQINRLLQMARTSGQITQGMIDAAKATPSTGSGTGTGILGPPGQYTPATTPGTPAPPPGPGQTPPIITGGDTSFAPIGSSLFLPSSAPPPPGYTSATTTREGTTYYF